MTLLKRFWNWLTSLMGKLVGIPTAATQNNQGTVKTFSDTDYEFLFFQLLEGVAHGWHGGRIVRFFEQLGEQGKSRHWVAWLNRYRDKVLSSSVPNLQLAARMMRLGELSSAFPKVEPIGKTAYEIGRELYVRQSDSTIWEYEGPDVESPAATPQFEPASSDNQQMETLTLEELIARLQQDEQLGNQLAQQLGLPAETDTQTLINTLVAQFTQSQQAVDDQQQEPETVEEWFNLGLQQANLGNLEEAIANWDKALELNPQLTQAWHNRGNALATLGRVEEALQSLDQALDLNPEDAQTLNTKAHVFYETQQWEKAITCWDQVLKLQPNLAQVVYNQACAYDNSQQIAEAIAGYKQALELQPDFPEAQSRLDELTSEQNS
ncbi:MAG: tetratricopeptide repeat protein [Microcystaceae cyanobacterium]